MLSRIKSGLTVSIESISNGAFGKKISVITVDPSSKNNSMDVLSRRIVPESFSLLEIRGAILRLLENVSEKPI